MTTHLRARTAQAGAFLALVSGLVAGIPAAAQAAAPGVTIDSVSERTVSSGSTVTISYTVSNLGGEGEPGNNRFNTDVTTSAGRCNNGCSPSDTITQSKTYQATLTAPTVAAGQKQTMTITVVSKDQTGAASQAATETISVEGPAAPTTVRQVSGRIKDDGGARVSGVQVVMKDSQGHTYTTTTDGNGGYTFNSSDSQPIAAGAIQVAAAKTGYEAADVTVQGAAGRTVNVPLTIKKTAAATSPTPSTSTSATSKPTDEATDDESAEGDPGVNNIGGNDTQQASNNTDDGGSNWLLIVMGGLLVAAGIGAMVLVWMRRKKAEELSSDTGIGQAVPAGVGGGFDATRVAAPVGAGRGNDATMIAPAGGMGVRPGAMGGGIGDAPTVIHRTPVEDEFPDPYGAPLPSGGNYGGNQWDGQQGGGNYGATQTYGQQGGGYGAAQGGGGYNDGGQQRYDEHTNLYQPEQPQRYDEHTNLYQPEQGGGQYGGGQYGGGQGGYDQGGYDQGWNGQDAGGYGQQGGYDQGGYGQQGGNYDGYDQGGYDQQQGGYPQQGGNYGNGYPQQGQPPQQGRGTYGQRPNRDWDDN